MKGTIKPLLWLIEFLWRFCLTLSFSIVSVWIYGSIIKYMGDHNMSGYAIVITQIVLSFTIIVLLFKIAIGKYISNLFRGKIE